jgi:hypothetical protein
MVCNLLAETRFLLFDVIPSRRQIQSGESCISFSTGEGLHRGSITLDSREMRTLVWMLAEIPFQAGV